MWSVTSFTELRRTGLEVERWNRIHEDQEPKVSWVEQCLGTARGPVVAATDYVRAVPDLIRTWVNRRYITLGTDGFGRSDTRAALRSFFEVDRTSIAFTAIKALVDSETVPRSLTADFMARYAYTPAISNPWSDKSSEQFV